MPNVHPLHYQTAFHRVHAEFSENPDAQLTPQEMHRLCGIDESVCQVVLEDLTRAHVLCVASDGSYVRPAPGGHGDQV